MTGPVAMCVHEDGTEHAVPVGADGMARFSTLCSWPEPPDVVALGAVHVRDALALVSRLVDEVLPMLLAAAWVSEAQRERLGDASESAVAAWAGLTIALAALTDDPFNGAGRGGAS